MATIVRLTVLTGPHRGSRFCFREPNGTTVGRAPECAICFRGAERDGRISRHHCQLKFDPPNVRVADLGSMNGTYLNGHRCAPLAKCAMLHEDSAPSTAQDGDILTIGGTSLQISIIDCPEWDDKEKIKKNCPVQC